MNNPGIFLSVFFLFITSVAGSQGVVITKPKLRADGQVIFINYDILTSKGRDLFYIWVEFTRADGSVIHPGHLSGDIGEKIKPGQNKEIRWDSDRDSIDLAEEISVEVKGEIYERSFNRAGVLGRSAIFPGWGQSVAKQGQPWWIAGAAVYGALAGSLVYHRKYLSSWDSYTGQVSDPDLRAGFYDKAQRADNISRGLMYGAATAWLVNLVWAGMMPDSYKPLKGRSISLLPGHDSMTGFTTLSLKVDF